MAQSTNRILRSTQSCLLLALTLVSPVSVLAGQTRVEIDGNRWLINGQPTNWGAPCEGLLMNVRMVDDTFEDQGKPGFDAEQNTDEFIAKISEYAALGFNAFTLCLPGGMPGYEAGIPADARYKPGSGGQLLAFVPCLDLVIARQTGLSGAWDYEAFLRRDCVAVLTNR